MTDRDRQAEPHQEKLARVLRDRIYLVPYSEKWPALFEVEKQHLLACLPNELLGRIEHYGSTAIPGMPAKPVIDMLVEVNSLEETRQRIVPILEGQGYDYFWRATHGEDGPPFYAWFIKRNASGERTHHIHMVEPQFDHWNSLYFRDYLIAHPDLAREYAALKHKLSVQYSDDRVAYTRGKTSFVLSVTAKAIAYYAFQHQSAVNSHQTLTNDQ